MKSLVGSVTALDFAQLGDALLLSALTFMHILYMLVVVNSNVLKDIKFPTTRPDQFKRYLTCALCLAYAAPLLVYLMGAFVSKYDQYAATYEFYGPSGSISKLTSLILFLVVYILWVISDLSELKHAKRDPNLAKPHILRTIRVWISIEAITVILIFYAMYQALVAEQQGCDHPLVLRSQCLGYFERWDVFGRQVSLFEGKDWFVTLCLGFFLIRMIWNRDSSPQTEIYPIRYAEYVAKHRVTEVDSSLGTALIEQLRIKITNGKVLDFACGNGQRLRQFATHVLSLDPAEAELIDVLGIDKNGAWEERFVFGESRFSTTIGDHANFDVIHISHALYERACVSDAVKVINAHAKDGALIVVRGASANTPTYMMSVALAGRLLDYHPHHHWAEIHLQRLVKSCRLTPLDPLTVRVRNRREPDVTVKQVFSLANSSDLSTVLGSIFAEEARDFSNEVLLSLKEARVVEVPTDDNLFVYRYNRN